MVIESKIFLGVILCFAVIILIVMLRSKHFFSCFLLSCLSGVGTLFAVNLLSGVTGFEISVNTVTLAISSLGGMPAVIALLFSRAMLL